MTVSRRDVLRLAGVGLAAGALDACRGGSSTSTPTPSTPRPTPPPTSAAPSPTASATPTAPDWAALRSSVRGQVLRPGDDAYDARRRLANPRYDDLRPAAIVRPDDAADVATAVAFARDAGVELAVRSGGHSYGGWSSGPGLVIDTSSLHTVGVDRGAAAATIGAGAALVDVYAAVGAAGVGIPAGSCPSVGIAGLTLGGGIGVLSRAWGLTCDAVRSLDVVTADGKVLTCSQDEHADLFWACRGGGGGSFGVVTSFTLRTRPAPDLSLFFLRWPLEAAGDVLDAWQRWAPEADPRLWSTAKALVRPKDGTSRVIVAGTWIGPADALESQLSSFLRSVGHRPVSSTRRRLSYRAAMLAEAGCDDAGPACHLPPTGTLDREAFAASSHVATDPLPRDMLSALLDAVAEGSHVSGMTEGGVSFDALGGAVAEVASDATAFVHRDARFDLQYTATYAKGSAAPYAKHVTAMRAAVPDSATSGAYVNYADPQLPDWETAYWGKNYGRLQDVKRAYDADNVFSYAQSVRV